MSRSGRHTEAERRLIGNREQPAAPGPNPEIGPQTPNPRLDGRAARLNQLQQRLQSMQQMPGGPAAIQNQIERRQPRSPNMFATNGMAQRQQMLGQRFQGRGGAVNLNSPAWQYYFQTGQTLPTVNQDTLTAYLRRQQGAPSAGPVNGRMDGRQSRLQALMQRLPSMSPNRFNRVRPGPSGQPLDFRQARLEILQRRLQNPSALTMNRVGPMVQSELTLQGRRPAGMPRGTPATLRRPEGTNGDWFGRLDDRLNRALSDRNLSLPAANARIESDPNGLANFDLPRNEPIGYVSLYDAKEPWEVDHLNAFPGMMNGAGYRFVTAGSPAMGVTSDPIGLLRGSLRQLQSQGVRYAYLNLVPHGNAAGEMIFQQPGGGRIVMLPNQITALTREFRTMRFFINVNSCHGGGFHAADFSDPGVSDLVPRVTVTTQSDRFTSTPVMMLPGNGERGVSYYDAILSRYLRQGVPYGRAHCLADQATQRMFPNRPGLVATAYRSGRNSPPRT